MKAVFAFVLAIALVAGGLWLSVGLGFPQIWLFGAGLVALVGVSSEAWLELPPSEPKNRYQSFTLWVAPGLLVIAGLWMTQVIPPDSQMVVMAGAALLMTGLLLALRASLQADGPNYRAGRFVANLILYLVIFLLFALIYHTKERSAMTATATGVVALLAAMETFRTSKGRRSFAWRTAALAGLVVAETTWALNYWPVSGLVGGALLLLTFYVFTGLLVAVREGALERRMLLEYGMVGVAGFVAIAWAAL